MNQPAAFVVQAAQAEAWTGGRWQASQDRLTLRGAAIDSRQVTPGAVFACIQGQRVDGHDFAAQAAAQGAALILSQRSLPLSCPQLIVDDVAQALARLAQARRQAYEGACWIAVSGANGKTTVKELLRAAASEQACTHATEGNRNNHLGVPLTIFAVPENCRWVVVELGANKGGEIAELAAIVQPDIGVCTGIGPAHLEGYGDLAGVARGEAAVFAAVPAGGKCFFSRQGLEAVAAAGDCSAAALEAIVADAAAGRELVVVGSARCPVTGEARPNGIELHCGEGVIQLPLLGQHNLANAHLAWRAAVAAGVIPEIALRGLAQMRPVPGRLRLLALQQGHRLFDDCYNANPASMRAALEELARQPGARLAVLAAMGELGSAAAALHRQVGAEAAFHGLPLLVVGSDDLAAAIVAGYSDAGGRDCQRAADCQQALTLTQERLAVGPTAILIKASHAAGLEQLVSGLLDSLSSGGQPPC